MSETSTRHVPCVPREADVWDTPHSQLVRFRQVSASEEHQRNDSDEEKGRSMNHALQDVRAGVLLMVGLAMLACICAVAACSTVMRPDRWADRKQAQF